MSCKVVNERNAMNLQTIELPDDLIAQVMLDTGKRTARAAVIAALKAHHQERMYEPLTEQQCAERMRKLKSPVRITPRMRDLGITPEFFLR
jgi:Arc/MetJ family transcription regulator